MSILSIDPAQILDAVRVIVHGETVGGSELTESIGAVDIDSRSGRVTVTLASRAAWIPDEEATARLLHEALCRVPEVKEIVVLPFPENSEES